MIGNVREYFVNRYASAMGAKESSPRLLAMSSIAREYLTWSESSFRLPSWMPCCSWHERASLVAEGPRVEDVQQCLDSQHRHSSACLSREQTTG